jgi:hypothetical protein
MNAKQYSLFAAMLAGGFSCLHGVTQDTSPVTRPFSGDVVDISNDPLYTSGFKTNYLDKVADDWGAVEQGHDSNIFDFKSVAFSLAAGSGGLVTQGSNAFDFADAGFLSSAQYGDSLLVLNFFTPIDMIVSASSESGFDFGMVGFENGYRNLLGMTARSGAVKDDIGLYEYGGGTSMTVDAGGTPIVQTTGSGTDGVGMSVGSADFALQGDEVKIKFWGRFDADNDGTWDTYKGDDKFYMDNKGEDGDPNTYPHFMGLVGSVYNYNSLTGTYEVDEGEGQFFMLGFDDKDNHGNWVDWDDGIILGRITAGSITPEPASIASFGLLGLLGLSLYRRRRARK